MNDIGMMRRASTLAVLERWQLDVRALREGVYRALTPRERERWHALWLLARSWSAAQVSEALGRVVHTIGDWVEDFRHRGPAGLAFEQSGGSPPPSAQHNRPS